MTEPIDEDINDPPPTAISRRNLLVSSGLTAALVAIGLGGPLAPQRAEAATTLTYRHPFNEDWWVPYAGEWGNNRGTHRHAGVDYNIEGGSAGKLIRSVSTGTVRGKSYHTNYGHRLWVQHDDGMWSHYAHMNAPSHRANGDRVQPGSSLGRVGNTGASRGAHLHLEMSSSQYGCNGYSTSVDPIDFIDTAIARPDPIEEEETPTMYTFFNHGDPNVDLWVYVLPNGDFVRIRDHGTASLWKQVNGGERSYTLQPSAIQLLVETLEAAGGRDIAKL